MNQYKAEIFDKIQYCFEEYKCNDHHLRCVMHFDRMLDRSALKKAILFSIDSIPILRCRYVEEYYNSYWEHIDAIKYEDVITFIQSSNTAMDLEKIITEKTDTLSGPQIKVFVVTSYKDTLCIIMNHMICDAAGFKDYLYLLSSIYSNLVINPSYIPSKVINGSRSILQVTSRISTLKRAKAIFSLYKADKQNLLTFPLSTGVDSKPLILTYKLDGVQCIKEYCKIHNATINDVILTAYYRSLYKILNLKHETSMAIPIMIDLRRYLENRKAENICNLTSIISSKIRINYSEPFEATLLKVKNEMDSRKDKLPGIGDFEKLSLAFNTFPYFIIKKLLGSISIFPLITLTNIGILDSNKIRFRGACIDNMFMTGSIKYKPYFQLALTTFKNTITFTSNIYGTLEDKQKIQHFFHIIDEELTEAVAAQ